MKRILAYLIISLFCSASLAQSKAQSLAEAINIVGILKSNGSLFSAAVNSDLPVMSATVGGAAPTPPNDATKYLDGTGHFTVPASGSGTVTHSSGNLTTGHIAVGNGTNDIYIISSLGTTSSVLHGNAAGLPSWGAVNLASDITGNLPVANLGSGTGATSSTYWRGDGTWATPAGGGGGSGTVTSVHIASANGFYEKTNATPTAAVNISLGTTLADYSILQASSNTVIAAPVTGSGNVVMSGSPSLTTPNIGTATGTASGNALLAGSAGQSFAANNLTAAGSLGVTGSSALTGGATIGDSSWMVSGTLHTGFPTLPSQVGIVSSGTRAGMSPTWSYGGLFGIKSSDLLGGMYWALGAIGNNDSSTASTTYGMIIENYRQYESSSSGSSQGIDIAVLNRNPTAVNGVDPYFPSPATNFVEGLRVYAQELSGPVNYTAQTSSVGITISGDGHTNANFKTGLNIGPVASGGDAIALAASNTIQWYSGVFNSSSAKSSYITASTSATANRMNLLFTDNQVTIQNNSTTALFNVTQTGINATDIGTTYPGAGNFLYLTTPTINFDTASSLLTFATTGGRAAAYWTTAGIGGYVGKIKIVIDGATVYIPAYF